MRAALSIVLATALITTPLKLVLAQAAKQEAVSVQQTAPPDSSRHRLIAVPPVTDNTSRLWEPLASEDVRKSIFTYDGSETWVAAQQEFGGGGLATVVGPTIALILVVFLIVKCLAEKCLSTWTGLG